MAISRRNFLRGTAASAVAAALPIPVLPAEPLLAPYHVVGPIFEGAVGVYHGIVFREVFDLRESAQVGLDEWYKRSQRRRAQGLFIETSFAGIEIDGD